jgi:uncharacterized BrkB/YihY/UPF0761 family membrane protein
MTSRPGRHARIFGIPADGFGLFATLLISVASGFIAFFGTTFLGILVGLVSMLAGHKFTDFDVTYKVYGLTAGILVFVFFFVYLMALWVRGKVRG